MPWPSRGKFDPNLFRRDEDPWDASFLSEEIRLHIRKYYENQVLQQELTQKALLAFVLKQAEEINDQRKKASSIKSSGSGSQTREDAPLRILDINAGLGSLAVLLAKQGFAITTLNSSLFLSQSLDKTASVAGVPTQRTSLYDTETSCPPGAILNLGFLGRRIMHNYVLGRYDLILVLGAECNQILSMDELNRLFLLLQNRTTRFGRMIFNFFQKEWFSTVITQTNRESQSSEALLPIPPEYRFGSAAVAFTQSSYLYRLGPPVESNQDGFVEMFVRDWAPKHIQFALQKTGWSTPRPASLSLPFKSNLSFVVSETCMGFRMDYPRFHSSVIDWFRKRDVSDYTFIFPGQELQALTGGQAVYTSFLTRFKVSGVPHAIYIGVSENGNLLQYWWYEEAGGAAARDDWPDSDCSHLQPFEWANPLFPKKAVKNFDGWLATVMDDKQLEEALDNLVTRLRQQDTISFIKKEVLS